MSGVRSDNRVRRSEGGERVKSYAGKTRGKKRQETFYSQIFRAHYYHNAWNRLNNRAPLAGSLS